MQKPAEPIKNEKDIRILLFSHELTYTGAPHSLLRIANVLKRAKYRVEIWAPKEGDFRTEIERSGIPLRIVPYEVLRTSEYIQQIGDFDLALANTVVADRFYEAASDIIPTIWFIREAQNLPALCDASPLRKALLCASPDLYCVSEYAQEFICRKYNSKAAVLHNCTEDYFKGSSGKCIDKVNFIAAGTFNKRKAFDVCYEAFSTLPEELQKKAHFYFAGQLTEGNEKFWKGLLSKIKRNPNTTYLGEITDTEKKISTFREMDVFVVVSRDESCSLVVLEGAMLGKPLIVSENVGAKYMVDENNGWVVKTGDVIALRDVLAEIIRYPERLQQMGEVSRKKYLEKASIPIYEESILQMVNEKLREAKSGLPFGMDKRDPLYALATEQERVERRNRDLMKRIAAAECELVSARNAIAEIRASWSYRIGWFVTWVPRKIYRGLLCCRDHGLWYTVKHAFHKVGRKFGGAGRCCREHGLLYTLYRILVHLHLAKEDSPHAPISKTFRPKSAAEIARLRRRLSPKKVAILVAAPNWEKAKTGGDYPFASAMKKCFERKGYEVEIRIIPEWDKPFDGKYVIVLRGRFVYRPKPWQVNIMWNISHPDEVSIEEYNRYDVVFVASVQWAEHLKGLLSVPVFPLLQCTDPEVFVGDQYDPDAHKRYELLFVGNSRGVHRQILKDLIPSPYELSVFGSGWETLIDGKYVKGKNILNNRVGKEYHDAAILLNDHWADMKEKGFISNRIFDGLSAGSFIISDEVEGLENVLKDCVVTYHDKEDLAEKVDYYMNHPEERRQIAERGKRIVREHHTFQARVDDMLRTLGDLHLVYEDSPNDFPK